MDARCAHPCARQLLSAPIPRSDSRSPIPARLAARPRDPGRPVFDGYRASAIIGVVLFHIFQVSGVFAALGDSTLAALLGILLRSLDVLFIVSGFVIYLPTVARDGDFGRVSCLRDPAGRTPVSRLLHRPADRAAPARRGRRRRRASRGPGRSPRTSPSSRRRRCSSSNGFSLGFGVVPPVWTLSVEVGFYIVLPLVAVATSAIRSSAWRWRRRSSLAWQRAGHARRKRRELLRRRPEPGAQARIDSYYASQFPAGPSRSRPA